MCSDRLDADFPDIDLSQLDTSDFDSVNCLSELQWCSDQQAGASPSSVHSNAADQLFEVGLSSAHSRHNAENRHSSAVTSCSDPPGRPCAWISLV